MPNMTDMPTFKDLVASEIARFVQIRQAQLRGDENPGAVLARLHEDISEGTWQNYADISVEDVRRKSNGS